MDFRYFYFRVTMFSKAKRLLVLLVILKFLERSKFFYLLKKSILKLISIYSQMFLINTVLENFSKSLGKHLYQRLSFQQPFQKETSTLVVQCEFCVFLQNILLQMTSVGSVLKKQKLLQCKPLNQPLQHLLTVTSAEKV